MNVAVARRRPPPGRRLGRLLTGLVVAVATCVLTLALPPRPAGATTGPVDVCSGVLCVQYDRSSPVLLVHGFSPLTAIGIGQDCRSTWGPLTDTLRADGWTGEIDTVRFLDSDSNCTADIRPFAGSTEYYGNGAYNNDTSIRHLALAFARYVDLNYSQRGIRVNVVAHSMGGLIVRYAAGYAGIDGFPRNLLLRNVVTIAAPNNGSPLAPLCTYRQCAEMTTGNLFLGDLNAVASNPLGHWHQLVGDNDTVAPPDSALVGVVAPAYQIRWHSPPYDHGNILTDTSIGVDANVDYYYRCDAYGQPHDFRNTTGVRSLRQTSALLDGYILSGCPGLRY